MSRLDQKVEEENRLAFITDKRVKYLDELRDSADLEIRDWLRANPMVGELQTEKGKTYYFWDTVSDCKVEVFPFWDHQYDFTWFASNGYK
jgi:hypothetical protein